VRLARGIAHRAIPRALFAGTTVAVATATPSRAALAFGPGAMDGLRAVVLASLAVWLGAFFGAMAAVIRSTGTGIDAMPRAAGAAALCAAATSLIAGLLARVPDQSPVATAIGLLLANLAPTAIAGGLGAAAGVLGRSVRRRPPSGD